MGRRRGGSAQAGAHLLLGDEAVTVRVERRKEQVHRGEGGFGGGLWWRRGGVLRSGGVEVPRRWRQLALASKMTLATMATKTMDMTRAAGTATTAVTK